MFSLKIKIKIKRNRAKAVITRTPTKTHHYCNLLYYLTRGKLIHSLKYDVFGYLEQDIFYNKISRFKPTRIYYNKTVVSQENWNIDIDLVKYVRYYDNKIELIAFERNKYVTFTYYYTDGFIKRIEHWFNDGLHRTDGPALIEYDETGKRKKEEWYTKGMCILRV